MTLTWEPDDQIDAATASFVANTDDGYVFVYDDEHGWHYNIVLGATSYSYDNPPEFIAQVDETAGPFPTLADAAFRAERHYDRYMVREDVYNAELDEQMALADIAAAEWEAREAAGEFDDEAVSGVGEAWAGWGRD